MMAGPLRFTVLCGTILLLTDSINSQFCDSEQLDICAPCCRQAAAEYNCTLPGLESLAPGQYEGVTVNYLSYVTAISSPNFPVRAKEFEACTGGKIVFSEAANVWEDPIRDLGTKTSRGSEVYDGYFMSYSHFPEASALGLAEHLNERIRTDNDRLKVEDVLPKVRAMGEYRKDGVTNIDFLMYDGDFFVPIVRLDLLEKFELPLPNTWEEVVDYAKFFNGTDLNDDGDDNDFGFCHFPRFGADSWDWWWPEAMYATWASYDQTNGMKEGFFFDERTLEPRVSGGFRRAAEIWTELWTHGSDGCNDNFIRGRCAIGFAPPGCWKGIFLDPDGVSRKDENGTVVWRPTLKSGEYAEPYRFKPFGSTQVYDRSSGQIKICTPKLCPKAEPIPARGHVSEYDRARVLHRSPLHGQLVNRAPFYWSGGLGTMIRKSSTSRKKDLMWDFFVYTNSPETSIHDVAFYASWLDSWRFSQLSPGDNFREAGWSEEAYEEHASVMKWALSNDVNGALNLRIPALVRYTRDTVGELMRETISGSITLDQMIRGVESEWRKINSQEGKIDQLEIYRSALGLDSLSTVELCRLHRDLMDERDPSTCRAFDDDSSRRSVLLPALLIPSIAVAFIVISIYVLYDRRRSLSDSVWTIKSTEINFGDQPEILGRGTFGLVLLAEYRGTQVAVKRVIPPKGMQGKSRRLSMSGETTETRPFPDGRRMSYFDYDDEDEEDIEKTLTSSGGSRLPIGSGTHPAFVSTASSTHVLESPSAPVGVAFTSTASSTHRLENPMPVGHDTHPAFSSHASSTHLLDTPMTVGHDTQPPFSSVASSTHMLGTPFGSQKGVSHASSTFMLPPVEEEPNKDGKKTVKLFRKQKTRRQLLDEYAKLKADFIDEMRHLSTLRHPCITTVMGAVIGPKEEPMLVMEYMQHGSLYDILHNDTVPLDGDLLLPIMQDVIQGMRFLHAASPSVIHGDLKAQNVLVDGKFRAKVADFGLSAKKTVGATGTPYWMAPELLRGESTNTPASDVYSFGMIMYEVYSRKDPYEGEDYHTVLNDIADPEVNKRPPVPDGCPTQVASIMTDCMLGDAILRPNFHEIDFRLKRMKTENAEPGALDLSSRARSKSRASRSQDLLFRVFPKHIAEALRDGVQVEPEKKDVVTVFFSDIVGFTTIAAQLTPEKVSDMLDRLYLQFDALSEKHDVFKIETVGDAYMCVTNLVKDQHDDHVRRVAEFGIDAIRVARETPVDVDDPNMGFVQIRVGFHSGPVIARVVGSRIPKYGIFGDTVNTAARMETNSVAGRVHCSDRAALLLEAQCAGTNHLTIASRGMIPIKGKGEMNTFFVYPSDERPKDNPVATGPKDLKEDNRTGFHQQASRSQSCRTLKM